MPLLAEGVTVDSANVHRDRPRSPSRDLDSATDFDPKRAHELAGMPLHRRPLLVGSSTYPRGSLALATWSGVLRATT
jgi:hypothetical protein